MTSSLRRKVDRLLAKYQDASRRYDEAEVELASAQRDLDYTTQALQLLQETAQKVQQNAHDNISRVVSQCLQAVFGENAYGFTIHFDKRRGRTEARLVFTRDGKEFDPLDESGGGVVDIACLALRVACLIFSRPPKRRLLVLDEPARFVSKEYRPLIPKMLTQLANDLGIQFIMVTHSPSYAVGHVVKIVGKKEAASKTDTDS